MMDGEVQPKFGLMVSLILMNMAAIVLFFFASTPSKEIAKQTVSTEKLLSRYSREILAGNSLTRVGVGSPVKNGSMEEGVDPLVDSLAKTGKVEVQNMSGKVDMRVVHNPEGSDKVETSGGPTEPPLAAALKRLVGSTNSGLRIFFEGLKNGYNKKRSRERTQGVIAQIQEPIELEPFLHGSNYLSPRNTKDLSPMPFPTQHIGPEPHSPDESEEIPPQKPETMEPWDIPSPTIPEPAILGQEASVSALNPETLPTEIVLNTLSSAQKRTNELIHLFNKKVMPAIERMNDRVAEAVRLEKNLDSYSSALINAINSVFSHNTDTEMNLNSKRSKPRTSGVKKFRQTNPFVNELPLMQDSRIHDYTGSQSKGEQSCLSKRPVFKTLAARCCHKRCQRIVVPKMRKQSLIVAELSSPVDERLIQPLEVSNYGQSPDILEHTMHSDAKDDRMGEDIGGLKVTPDGTSTDLEMDESSLKIMESPFHRTIGIEEVLALTSSLEQSSDLGIRHDPDVQSFYSPLNSNLSISSALAFRSCVIDSVEPQNSENIKREIKCYDAKLGLEQTQTPVTAASQSLELPVDLSCQARHKEDVVPSDFSVVVDSRIQDYYSDSAHKETNTVASPENYGTPVTDSSKPTEMNQSAELEVSTPSISFSGELKSTTELVNVFQQLNRQQKEMAMENVCLLVLRMFDAWTECQRSISSLGVSKMSLSSWPSAEEISPQCSRPRTAIHRSRIDSHQAQTSIMANSFLRVRPLNDGKSNDLNTNDLQTVSDHISAEISRTMVQNVVGAAEVQIAERSLKGLKTNMLRNPVSKGDVNCSDLVDVANLSGFGDIKDTINVDEELAVSLMSKSRESFKASKESSAATFYTTQPESSEDTFFECVSTMSAGTYLSNELEVKDSSTLFLERIQEEETKLHKTVGMTEAKHSASAEPYPAKRSVSVDSWLTDSGEELFTAKETQNSEELPASDNSSFDVACGTDDEAYLCSSQDLSADESKADESKKSLSKKKKWAAKFFNKFLKKKSKPSSLPSLALSKNASRSQSDSVLKPSDQDDLFVDNDKPTQ